LQNEQAQEAHDFALLLIGNNLPKDMMALASEKLKRFASPICLTCRGSGVFYSKNWKPNIYLHWANGNGHPILRLLGVAESELHAGEMRVSLAIKAAEKAMKSSVKDAIRPEQKVFDKPRKNQNGTWELRPIRTFKPELSESGIKTRLSRFLDFVNDSASQGATKIWWS